MERPPAKSVYYWGRDVLSDLLQLFTYIAMCSDYLYFHYKVDVGKQQYLPVGSR